MSPIKIAQKAKEHGLDIVALTDHNSAQNCPAFEQACNQVGLLGLFGIEVTTMEECHIVVLFKTVEESLNFSDIIATRYTGFKNNPEKMGYQLVVDLEENILKEIDTNLAQGATDIPMSELEELTHSNNGLFIVAHIDRLSYSVSSQLGFLPPGNYNAIETINTPCPIDTGENILIQSSDAHFLEDIAKRSSILSLDNLSTDAIWNHFSKNKKIQ